MSDDDDGDSLYSQSSPAPKRRRKPAAAPGPQRPTSKPTTKRRGGHRKPGGPGITGRSPPRLKTFRRRADHDTLASEFRDPYQRAGEVDAVLTHRCIIHVHTCMYIHTCGCTEISV